MDGRWLMMVLRLVHILGGLFWVGSAAILTWFLFPAQRAAGAGGGSVMQEIMGRRRLGMWMGIAAVATLLSGFALYGRNAALSNGSWPSSPTGIGYGIGALAALLGLGLGMGIGGPMGRRLQRLGATLGASAGPPDQSVVREMARLQRRSTLVMRLAVVLLLVAAATMATARYW